MKKSLAPWICSLALLPFVSCVHLSNTSTDPLTFSTDQTVMLHWLEVDDTGIVREAEIEGNLTKQREPFSGKAIETFEQSPTKSISSWKDGQRHGITLEYFYNGRKRTSIVYKNGNRHGPSQEFRITGELWREETYQEDQLTGPKSEWHPNGVKSFQVEMREGVAHGEAKEWYADGTEKSATIYRHGLREGPSSEWYPNGQQKLGLFYQKDQQHGLRTIWYENGKKRLSAQFLDDMMEGNSKGWFLSGQQQFDYNFKNNLEHGVCTEWDESGEKISEIRFNNGVPAQDLLTGQRIVAPSSPPIAEELKENKPALQENSDEIDALEKVDLPPLPENEKDNIQTNPRNKLPKPTEPDEGKKDKSNKMVTEDSKTNPTSKDPLPPSIPVEIPPPPQPKSEKVIKKSPEDILPPPPPAPAPAPSFDPFGDLPSLEEPQTKEPPTSAQPPSENPFGNDSLEASGSSNFPAPSIPDTFDPFGEELPQPAPAANPFEETQPAPESPFNDAPPAPPANFDPFGESPDNPQSNNDPEEVPLGDVFANPAPTESKKNDFTEIPEPPPPPPTFDPFEN